jgi:HAD superfamily phosphoserine phosphatase-like hydrolase
LEEIERLKKEGMVVVVVSASPENWIKEWANGIKVELIASQLEMNENRITGKIMGKNCHGEEKVRRILEKYTVSDFAEIHAYGDTKGDLHMMSLAHNAFYKPFRN